MQACDHCHGKKVRCDKSVPCRRCRNAGLECHYTDRTKGRLYSQSHVDTLERKIHRLELRNRVLFQQASSVLPVDVQPPSAIGDGGQLQHIGSSSASPPSSSAGKRSRPADVIGEVSYLSINAAGERHYLGSSSGILLAKFIKANVEVEAISRPPSPNVNGNDTGSPNALADATPDLPPESVSSRLALAYLNHDHLCYPVIEPGAVLALVMRIYGADGTYYTLHPSEAFVFDMVLAIATANTCASDRHILPAASSHYARAITKVFKVMESGGLISLQAIILLIQYRMSSSIRDNSASMWHLVGMGSRIALELGLHRESAYPLKYDTSWEPDSQETESYVLQEVSRLCFWSIICVDRIVSNILGRPLAIREEDVDATLPNLQVDYMFLSRISEPNYQDMLRHDRMPIFTHIVRYRLLCGQIMTTMHTKPNPDQNVTDIRTRRWSLSEDLAQWRQQSANLGLSTSTLGGSAPSSCFASAIWLDMIYHNAMLMLYRPSPTLDTSRDAAGVQTIFTSAKQSIAAYTSLHRARMLNHSWLTLQAIFMSGLSYVYAVTMHFQERRRLQGGIGGLLIRDPSTIEVVSDTRACSNVLVAVSERWKSLQHCFDVFNRLSDAVLLDVIKFESGSVPYTGPNLFDDGFDSGDANPTQLSQSQEADGSDLRWNAAQFAAQAHEQDQVQTTSFNPSPLAIENEFRDSFNDLQELYNQQHIDISVFQLSQAWFDTFGVPSG